MLQAFVSLLRQECVYPTFPINLGEWAFPVLLPKSARLLRGPVFEVERLLPALCLCTKEVVVRGEEPLSRVARF